MKRSLLLCLFIFTLGIVAHATYQTFTSTVTVTVNLANPTVSTQAIADNQRDARLVDFCKAYNLDIYTVDSQGKPTTAVDNTKVIPAFRNQVKKYVVEVIKGYRSGKSAAIAGSTTTATEDTVVP